jgi:nicotinamide riboside kinase
MTRKIVSAADVQARPVNVAIWGRTKGGKTTLATRMAMALWRDYSLGAKKKVLFIDTENARSQYATSDAYGGKPPDGVDRIDWKPPYDMVELVAIIKEYQNDYDVIVLDSFSAFYSREGGTLDRVGQEEVRMKGNSWAAWKRPGEEYASLLTAITQAPCHVIVTFRSKMSYQQVEEGGKKKIVPIGEGIIARQGETAYEFDLEVEVLLDNAIHYAVIQGSRISTIATGTVYKGGLPIDDILKAYTGFMGTPQEIIASQAAAAEAGMSAQEFKTNVESLISDPALRKLYYNGALLSLGWTWDEIAGSPESIRDLYYQIDADYAESLLELDDDEPAAEIDEPVE